MGDSEDCPYKETRDSNKEEEEERGKSYKESLKSNKELSESNNILSESYKEVKELHSEKTESYQTNISPYKSIQAQCEIELEPYKEGSSFKIFFRQVVRSLDPFSKVPRFDTTLRPVSKWEFTSSL